MDNALIMKLGTETGVTAYSVDFHGQQVTVTGLVTPEDVYRHVSRTGKITALVPPPPPPPPPPEEPAKPPEPPKEEPKVEEAKPEEPKKEEAAAPGFVDIYSCRLKLEETCTWGSCVDDVGREET